MPRDDRQAFFIGVGEERDALGIERVAQFAIIPTHGRPDVVARREQ